MSAAELDHSEFNHLDRGRFDTIMALFEDLPGGGRACMLEPFLGMLDLQVPRLEQAVEIGDPVPLREAAHSLKGSSRELGFVRLGDCSEALESAGREERIPDRETCEAFDQELEWVRSFIRLQ